MLPSWIRSPCGRPYPRYLRETDTTRRRCDSTSFPAASRSLSSLSFLANSYSSSGVSIGRRLTAEMYASRLPSDGTTAQGLATAKAVVPEAPTGEDIDRNSFCSINISTLLEGLLSKGFRRPACRRGVGGAVSARQGRPR